jgi:hypothetical protein
MNCRRLFLTEAQIDGSDPVQAAWQSLIAHTAGLRDGAFVETIRQLPQHWRAVYTVFHLNGEVNNGGHHQFFWNSDGSLNNETLADLRLISAKPFILLFEEALDEYQRHDYAGDKRDSGNTWEAFSEAYREERMAILDAAFCKLPGTLVMCLADYIRSNRDLYRAKP